MPTQTPTAKQVASRLREATELWRMSESLGLRLYTAPQNSAGDRVRIALHLKGISYQAMSVPDLAAGEYRRINPQGLMPALEVDGAVIPQSGAILDFLDRTFPDPPLLPANPMLRAQSLAFGQLIAGEMHALTIHRVRRELTSLGVTDAGVGKWLQHWLGEGHAALEEMLARRERDWPFCFGESPGWADLHLVPQLANARRFGVPLSDYPRLLAVESRCLELEAFQRK